MKLHEEFKEYENLWETRMRLMWTTPVGKQLDLYDNQAVEKEINKMLKSIRKFYLKSGKLTNEKVEYFVEAERKVIEAALEVIKDGLRKLNASKYSAFNETQLIAEHESVLKILSTRTDLSKEALQQIKDKLDNFTSTRNFPQKVYSNKIQSVTDQLKKYYEI